MCQIDMGGQLGVFGVAIAGATVLFTFLVKIVITVYVIIVYLKNVIYARFDFRKLSITESTMHC